MLLLISRFCADAKGRKLNCGGDCGKGGIGCEGGGEEGEGREKGEKDGRKREAKAEEW